MHIVTDGQGSYAIRKFYWLHLRYAYLDLKAGFWCLKTSPFYYDCWSPDIKLVKSALGKLKPRPIRQCQDISAEE
jgi:hypothetical protein